MPSKRAFLVLAPESHGSHLVTDLLVHAGCHGGSGDHVDWAPDVRTLGPEHDKPWESELPTDRQPWDVAPPTDEDPIVWRKDLDPVVKEKLRQFFLTYAQGDTPEAEQQRGYLKRLSIGGFKPADDTHLLVVREMEATEQLGIARESGDQAKIAAAQKVLDGVKAERVAAEGKAGVVAQPAN